MRVILINELDLTGELTKVLQGVESGLDIAANQINGKFLQPTSEWNHKPEFTIESAPKERTISTDDVNFVRVNNGTNRKGRFVYPRNKKALRLPVSSRPKTIPFNFQGQEGGSTYEDGKNIIHGGIPMSSIEPRGWDELIEYEYSSEFSGGGKLSDIIQQEINKT